MTEFVVRDVADRKGIIGCSQLGSLLNVSSYGTPYTVYKDYIGESDKVFTEEQLESMEMGTAFEDMIARYGAKKYGVEIEAPDKAWVHPEIPQFICHPDRLVVGKVDGKTIGIECKMVQPYSQGWGEPDTDEVPDGYHLQCLGYISCKVCDEVWLFVMKGNRIYRYIITKNEKLIEIIETEVKQFIKNVENGVVYKADTYALVIDEFPEATEGKGKVANDKIMSFVAKYKEKEFQAKQLENEMNLYKAKIAEFMEDAEILRSDIGEKLVTFKNQTSHRLDSKRLELEKPNIASLYMKETSSRVMRFTKPSKKKA